MRDRKQNGQVVRIGDRWFVRYWERRNVAGKVERKRVSHVLGPVTTTGKRPPADVITEADRYMATTVNGVTTDAERIVTMGDFVERVYLCWVRQYKRPSTLEGVSGRLGRPPQAALRKGVAQGNSYLSRSRVAKRNRRGCKAEPQHPEAHQERNKRNFHSGKAAGLFPRGEPRSGYRDQS